MQVERSSVTQTMVVKSGTDFHEFSEITLIMERKQDNDDSDSSNCNQSKDDDGTDVSGGLPKVAKNCSDSSSCCLQEQLSSTLTHATQANHAKWAHHSLEALECHAVTSPSQYAFGLLKVGCVRHEVTAATQPQLEMLEIVQGFTQTIELQMSQRIGFCEVPLDARFRFATAYTLTTLLR